MTQELEISPAESDYSWLADSIFRRPTKRRNRTISEYAETTVIPAGKYRGVYYRNDRAPYMREPLDAMSPGSNIQEVRLMWPAQTGKTTVSEICTSYFITEFPSDLLYISSNAVQARKWMTKRIEPRAIAQGIEFRAQTENKASRRSGDTAYSKEFDGGSLDIASALSAASLASETKRVVLADEVDRWKEELGDEGFTWDIMYARTQAWGDQRKILSFSTPTTYDASKIFPLYEEGDQREYWVQCPICGEFQTLTLFEWKKYGLYWETKAGKLDIKSIMYICPSCNKAWKENRKIEVLNTGEWRPGVEPKTPYIQSYHINGIYSPFLDWKDIAEHYMDAQGNSKKKQTFINLKMGLPHRETGARPKAEKVYELRGVYHAGTVPEGVLYLTIGADVQLGSEGNPEYPPRIELEVLGIGAGYRTWSIDYKVFRGQVIDPFSGAWEKLHQWAIETRLSFKRKDGREFCPELIFIDSGAVTDVVYRFCQRWENTYPIKGDRLLKRRKNEKGDERTAWNFRRYRAATISAGITLYEISTNYYKTNIYNNLTIKRQDFNIQPPGFCDFPFEYGHVGTDYEKYFDMLTAEEKRRDGSFHSGGRRNEALDCRVYAMCAGDVFLDLLVLDYKAAAKKAGATHEQLRDVNHRVVLDILKDETGAA